MTPTAVARPSLSILIPVLNEAATVGVALKVLEALVEVPHETLVVHDAPDDTSVPVVRKLIPALPHVRLVHNARGPGIANALRAGIAAAEGDYLVMMLADDIGPMTAIGDMVKLMDEGCDLVSCTRYARGGKRLGGSLVGHALSRLANWLFHRLGGCALTDATTCIKMFRRSTFERFTLEAEVGFAVTFELAIKAQAAGLTLGEVPISSADRLYGGQSTFRVLPWTWEYLQWFVWGVRHLRANRHRRSRAVRVPAEEGR